MNISSSLSKILIFSVFLILSSCTYKKNIIYFQGTLDSKESNKNYSPTLRCDDLLSINVVSFDMDAVKPFNLPSIQANSNLGGYTQGTPPPPGYLIDTDGYVDFPVVGRIKLAGLTRKTAIDTLKQYLKPYVTNPSILLRILNYKVTVLGEVKNPGTFIIPSDRITLPEAIGIAGDLNITAKRKNVLVIRETDGKRTETRVDLTSKEIFSSPVFYLQQNDVVYVEPNRAKINSGLINPSNVSLIISVISLLITMTVLFKK
jgi:polysaccharide export outer membrane protein